MENALVPGNAAADSPGLKAEFGPIGRRLARRFFEGVRFSEESVRELARMHEQGFVVHVMRTTAWVNFLYLTWALVRRGLPPVRAVVNLRRWFSRPWRRTAQRGSFEVRFTYARRQGGSGLVFLRQAAFGRARGRSYPDDPFPALVAMARRSDRPVFLVPELFVWEKWIQRLKPGIIDYLFGSPEAPGFLHTLLAFLRNYDRAQLRVGEPIELQRFLKENPRDPDEILARKVRGALNHHLARESRAVFGPPTKPTSRIVDEAMRDRSLRAVLEQEAASSGRGLQSTLRHARRDLWSIAARLSTTMVGLTAPILRWVFNRIYEGIDVDETGFDRAMKMGARAPIVLVPSHKSHVDYLVLSYVLWTRGYAVPHIAAGANLSFWPLGPYLRRVGAYFLRRSFKGDRVYAAAFRAYIKRLVHDGIPQEFFPEGGRSRTGKLLVPKLGLLSWQVEAVLEGARNDLIFIPVAIDYEKIIESSSYSRELAGGEKKPEDLRALLSTPKVLVARYGRIHLAFDEPISLADFARSRGIEALTPAVADEPRRALVRSLGHRIMHGISRASTVTPSALLATALLCSRERGLAASDLGERIGLLRRLAADQKARFSRTLQDAPSDPAALGPINEAMSTFASDGLVTVAEAKGTTIYAPDEARRIELSFYKNTLMNLLAPQVLVASAVCCAHRGGREQPRDAALFLSRLFKFEFIYRVGSSFDEIFSASVALLERHRLVTRQGDGLGPPSTDGEHRQLEFLALLLRDFLESYRLVAESLTELESGPVDRKQFLAGVLETGRAEFLRGRLTTTEALSRPNLENAVLWLLEQGFVSEEAKQLSPGPNGRASDRSALVGRVRSFLEA